MYVGLSMFILMKECLSLSVTVLSWDFLTIRKMLNLASLILRVCCNEAENELSFDFLFKGLYHWVRSNSIYGSLFAMKFFFPLVIMLKKKLWYDR